MWVPDLSDAEQLKSLRASFPFHNLTSGSEASKAIAEHLEKIGQYRGIRIENALVRSAKSYLTLSFQDAAVASAEKCPKLRDNGLCDIHEDRPTKCRTVPFDETIPESLAGIEARNSIDALRMLGGECDTSRTAEIVWKNGKFMDERLKFDHAVGYAHEHDRITSACRAVLEEIVRYFSLGMNAEAGDVIRSLEILISRGTIPFVNLIPVLWRLNEGGWLAKEQSMEVLKNQIALIGDRLLDIDVYSMAPGFPERSLAELLEEWLSMYENTLSNWSQA